MNLNKKIFIKPSHWITMMAVCTIICLNGCGCGVEGKGEVETNEPSEGDASSKAKENTSKATSYTAQDIQDLENEAETKGNQLFEALKVLHPQTAQQKEADTQAIKQLIQNLSDEEKVMVKLYLAATDMEEEKFIELFTNVTTGEVYFKQILIPFAKGALARGMKVDVVNTTINNKKNGPLTEQERDGLLGVKEVVQKLFITPLTKVAKEQAKNPAKNNN